MGRLAPRSRNPIERIEASWNFGREWFIPASPNIRVNLCDLREISCDPMDDLAQQSRSGRVRGRAPEELLSDYRRHYEALRVKHWVNRNLVKLYNKAGSVLRAETTMNYTLAFNSAKTRNSCRYFLLRDSIISVVKEPLAIRYDRYELELGFIVAIFPIIYVGIFAD